MPPPSERSAVELFHLVLLRVVAAGADRDHLVVKGGCNLRFFHGSPRHSEDLDLDARVASASTTRKRVDKALEGTTLSSLLRAHGVTQGSMSAPKQTETTPRWKIGLVVEGDRAMELPFRAFRSQVVEYLVADQQPLYDSRDAWEQMQLRVVAALEELRG